MSNAIHTTSVINVATSTVKQSSAEISTNIMQRIENLAVAREAWENTEYDRSNQSLYKLIADCLALYNDLISGDDAKHKKQGLNDYINTRGYQFKGNSPLSLKVIRCVFGGRDRRRLSTYHTAFQVAIAEKWAVDEVTKNIFAYGGVQEMSLRKPGGITAKDKAIAARAALMGKSVATLTSDALSKQFNNAHNGDNAVAVLTQNSDGTYNVHCVVHSATAVNAAFAGYFSANKKIVKGFQEQLQQQAAEADKSQRITEAAAAAAANDAQVSQAA